METIQHTEPTRHHPPDELAARMRALFRTMADFYRAQPWRCAVLATHRVCVTIPILGMREAVLQLHGDDLLPPGFFLFACADDIDRLVDETDAHRRGHPAICPPLVVLTFEAPPDQTQRERIDRDHLDLAAPDAFPMVARVGDDFRRGPAEPLDVVLACIVAAALTAVVHDMDADAWERGEPVVRTVQIHLGDVAISIRNADVEAPGVDDIVSRLAELERTVPLDDFRRIALEEELLRDFAGECALRGMPDWFALVPRLVFDAAARDHGVTIASLGAGALQKVLFDSLPDLDALDASQAYSFVAAFMAFLRFMKSEHGLASADGLLDVLGVEAAERLESRIRAVSPGWVPNLPHPVDQAPPSVRTDRAARRAKRRG